MSLALLIWILIIVCMITVIFCIVRHWKKIVSLDVDTLSQEKYAKTKQRILEDRIMRKTSVLAFPFKWVGKVITKIYEKLKRIERRQKRKKQMMLLPTKVKDQIRILVAQGEDLVRKEDFGEAEKKFIDVLGVDAKNIRAYKGLADLYERKKDKKSAIEVYSHITLLDQKDHETLYKLAEILKEQHQLDQARIYAEKALDIEPNNPKYLHFIIELSMLMKDTKKAKEFLHVLKKKNPENKNIDVWENQIKALEE